MSLIVVTEFEFVSWRMQETWFQFLLRLREQSQSIVMSISVCVCLSVREHISGNAWSLPIFLSMLPMAVAQSSCGRGRNPKGRGSFGCLGHPKALAIFAAAITAAFAAKGIIQSPITPCCRRDHSRQVQIGIRKTLSTGDAVYRRGRRWWEWLLCFPSCSQCFRFPSVLWHCCSHYSQRFSSKQIEEMIIGLNS